MDKKRIKGCLRKWSFCTGKIDTEPLLNIPSL